MMLIGITGGIGSGKSTIARALQTLGYAVYDTDREAKRIIVENTVVRSQIEYLFGSEVYDGDRYRTDVVAQQVFADKSLLLKLNKVVHPAVGYDLKHWVKQQKEEQKSDLLPVCFVESAILWESGIGEHCDLVVEVTAPRELRIQRTIQRDHTNREAVEQRIDAQQTETNVARANIIICNDGQQSPDQLAIELLEKTNKLLSDRLQ